MSAVFHRITQSAWHLQNGNPPCWGEQFGPKSLVIIDEAGMADALRLDTVVSHIINAGGSVRLIGSGARQPTLESHHG